MSFVDDVVNSNKNTLRIFGVPGAGKTTEVVNIASSLPLKRFLYLSFGRENTKSARAKMPANVTSSSFHAFAKNATKITNERITPSISMSGYAQSLNQIGLNIKSPLILESFSLLNELFCISELTLKNAKSLFSNPAFPNITLQEQSLILRSFYTWWSECWQPNSKILITHDMYFKHYSLTCTSIEFDYLVIDECQDLSDAMFYMSLRLQSFSPGLKTIRLGDPCQQLFGFRGASEQFALDGYDLSLPKTHRFGQALANLTNDFMAVQNIGHYTPIESSYTHTSVNNSLPPKELVDNINNGFRPTLIAKYNISLWYMLKILTQRGIKCAILGGIDRKELSSLKELYQLFVSEDVGRKGKFKGLTFERFRTKASISRDNAAMLACNFIESLQDEGGSVFSNIEKNLVEPRSANVMLATVHQSKGLEFEHVIMMDDFYGARDGGIFLNIPRREAYLIYTAMTRAKKSITLPKSWGKIV